MGTEDQPRDDHGRWTSGGGGDSGGEAWSGGPKVVSDDDIFFDGRGTSEGPVFRRQMKQAFGEHSELLMNGAAAIVQEVIPGNAHIHLNVDPGYKTFSVAAHDNDYTREIQRDFHVTADGRLIVEHSLFTLSKNDQGQGTATRMMADSLDLYERIGVDQINVVANKDVGAYAWAALGFQAKDPKDFELAVTSRRSTWNKLSEDRKEFILTGMEGYAKDAPSWLAKQPEGRALLLGLSWEGRIHLKEPYGKAVAAGLKSKGKRK